MPGEMVVDIWYTRPDPVVAGGHLADCEVMLSRDERERAAAFVRPADRSLFVVSRAVLRTALSRYAPIRPTDWRFRRSPLGKPTIEQFVPTALDFSLTHTAGFCGCAVAGVPVGLDAEPNGRPVSIDLITSCLSPAESARWHAYPPADPAAAFLTLWTLKEASMKGRGLGLHLPPTAVGFDPKPDGTADARFEPECDDDPAAWTFRHLRLGGTHVAVAVRSREPVRLAFHELSPEELSDSRP